MSSREKRLAEAKLKLEKFQKFRNQGSYAVQSALAHKPSLSTKLLSRPATSFERASTAFNFTRDSESPELDFVKRKLELHLPSSSMQEILKRNKLLAETIKNLENELQDLAKKDNRDTDELVAKIDALQLELEASKKEKTKYEELYNSILDKESESNSRIESLLLQVQEYQMKIETLQKSCEDAQSKIDEISLTNQLLNNESEKVEQVEFLQKELERHISTEKDLRSQIDELERAKMLNIDEIKRLESIVAEKTLNLSNLENQLARIETESESKIESLMKQIESLQAQNHVDGWEGNWEIGDAEFYPGRRDNEYLSLEKTVKDLEIKLKQEREKHSSEVLALNEKIVELEALQTMQTGDEFKEFQDSDRKSTDWEGNWEISDPFFYPGKPDNEGLLMNQEMSQVKQELKEIKSEHHHEVEKLQEKIKELENERQDDYIRNLENELEMSDRIRQDLSERVRIIQEERDELEHSLKRMTFVDLERSESAAQISTEVEKLKMDKMELIKKTHDLENELAQAKDNIRENQNSSAEDNNLLVETLSELNEKNANAKQRIKQLESLNHELETKNLRNISKVLDLENEIDSWRQRYEDAMVELLTEKALIQADFEYELCQKDERIGELEYDISQSSLNVADNFELDWREAEERIVLLEGIIESNTNTFNSILSEKDGEIAGLHENLKHAEVELETSRKQLHEQMLKNEDLSREYQEAIIAKNEDLVRKDESSIDLSTQLDLVRNESMNLISENSQLREKNDELLKRISELETELDDAANVAQEWETYTNNTVNQLKEEYEIRLIDQNNSIETLSSELREMKSKFDNLGSAQQTSEFDYLKDLKEQNSELLEINESLSQKMKDLESQLSQVAELKDQQYGVEIERLNSCIEMLEHERQTIIGEKAQLLDSKENDSQKIAQLETNLNILVEEKDHYIQMYETLVFEQHKESKDVEFSQEDKMQMEQELANLRNEYEIISMKAGTLMEENEKLKVQVSTLSSEIAILQSQVEKSFNEEQSYSQKILNLETELNTFQDTISSQLATIEDLELKVQHSSQAESRLEQVIQSLEAKLLEKQSRIEEIESEKMQIETQINELTTQLNESYTVLDEWQQYSSKAEQERDQALEELKNLKDSSNEADIKIQLDEQHVICENLRKEKSILEKEALEYQAQLQEYGNEKLSMQSLIDEKDLHISTLIEDKNNLEFNIARLDEQLLNSENNIQQLNKEFSELAATYDAAQNEHEKSLRELEIALDSLRNSKIELESKLNDSQQVAEQLQMEYEFMKENFDRKEQDLDYLRNEHKLHIEEYNNKICQLEHQLSEQLKIIESHSSNLNHASNSLETEKSQREQLELELQTIRSEYDSLKYLSETLQSELSQKEAEHVNSMNLREEQYNTLLSQLETVSKIKNDLEEAQLELRASLDEAVEITEAREKEISRLTDKVNTLESRRYGSPARVLDFENRPFSRANEELSIRTQDSKAVGLERELAQAKVALQQKDSLLEASSAAAKILEDHISLLESKLRENDKETIKFDNVEISSKEYASLTSKAMAAEQAQSQIETLMSLVDQNNKDISILRESIHVLVKESSSNASNEPGGKRYTRQIEELRKVWSHELSANNMLRNLFTKAQTEASAQQQQTQRIIAQLKEDCDQATNMYENACKELTNSNNEKEGIHVKYKAKLMQMQANIDSLIRDQQQSLFIQREAFEKEVSLLKQDMTTMLLKRDRILVEHGQEIDDMIRNHSKEIKAMQSNNEAQIRKIQEGHLKNIQSLKDSHQDEIVKLTDLFSSKIKKLHEEHKSELDLKDQESDAKIKKLKIRNEEEITRLEEQHRLALISEQENHKKTIRLMTIEHEDKLRDLENDTKRKIFDLRNSNDMQKQDLEKQFKDEMNNVEVKYERKISALKEENAGVIDKLRLQFEAKLKEGDLEHQRVVENIHKKHSIAISSLNSSFEESRSKLEHDHALEMKSNEERYKQSVATWKLKVENLDQKIIEIEDLHAKALLKASTTYESSLLDLQQQNSGLQQKLLQEQNQRKDDIAHYKSLLANLEEEKSALEEKQTKEMSKATQKFKTESDELKSLYEGKIKELSEKHENTLRIQVEERRKDIDDLQTKYEEKIEQLQSLHTEEQEKLKKALQRMETEAEERLKQTMSKITQDSSDSHLKEKYELELKIKTLVENIDALKAELDRTKTKIVEYDTIHKSEISSYLLKLKTASEKYQALEQKLASNERKLEEAHNKRKEGTYHLKQSLEEVLEQKMELEEKVTAMEQKLVQTRAKLQDCEQLLLRKNADLDKFQKSNNDLQEAMKKMDLENQNKLKNQLQEFESIKKTLVTDHATFEAQLNEEKKYQIEQLKLAIKEERSSTRQELNQEIQQIISFEQQKAREILNARIGEMRYKYDNAIEEMRAQRRKLEAMLDETENALADEREVSYRQSIEFAERERILIDEIRVLEARIERRERHERGMETPFERPDRWAVERHELERELAEVQIEFEKERQLLERKIFDLVGQVRHLDRNLIEQEEMFEKEREKLIEEMSRIKEESSALQQNANSSSNSDGQGRQGLINLLQEEKTKLEEKLAKSNELVQHLESRLTSKDNNTSKSEEYDIEKHQFELVIAQRDQDLNLANSKISKMKLELDSYAERLSGMRDYIDPETFAKLKRQAETQIRFERDRAKRLAYKIEDMKKNRGLKQDGNEDFEKVKQEAMQLAAERQEITTYIKDLHKHVFDESTVVDMEEIDVSAIQETCAHVIQEILYTRGLVNRLMLWRADLKYQKLYLSLKVEDLLASHRATLAFIHGMGVQEQEDEVITPFHKFKRCANAVIAVFRMKLLALQWQNLVDGNVDYDKLKRLLKEDEASEFTTANETEFIKVLEEELAKIWDFCNVKSEELHRRVEHCEAKMESILKSGDQSESRFDVIEDEMGRITTDVSELSKFIRMNYSGFVKILKKHDKHTTFVLKNMFMVRLQSKPFFKLSFDKLIFRLSKLYDSVRTGGKKAEAPPPLGTSFQRRTTKYWVHPDNVTEVKIHILKHLPVLVFGKEPDPAITSIYFDNDAFELYQGRLEKSQGAEALRLRWYGNMNQTQIFVERKTHHEDWTGESSIKERFPIKEKHVNAYLAGNYTMDHTIEKMRAKKLKSDKELDEMLQLSHEVRERIAEKGLKPMVRTFYNRTAFQLPGDARVRISLDTELTMIREDNYGKQRSGENWRRTDAGTTAPFSHLPDEDVCNFPYAVLEVKLQTQHGTTAPEWVQNLIDSHLVEEVPKFSKFIHGVATLLENKVSLLPFWFPQMDKDIKKPVPEEPLIGRGTKKAITEPKKADEIQVVVTEANEEEIAESAPLLKKKEEKGKEPESFLAGLTSALQGSSSAHANDQIPSTMNQKRIILPVRVEPKVFFANERTFLSWLHFCIVLGGLALGLLNFGDSVAQISGLIFTLVSMIFMLYALFLYQWRAHKIRTRDAAPYDDRVGPTVLVGVLFCAVMVNFYLKFTHGP